MWFVAVLFSTLNSASARNSAESLYTNLLIQVNWYMQETILLAIIRGPFLNSSGGKNSINQPKMVCWSYLVYAGLLTWQTESAQEQIDWPEETS